MRSFKETQLLNEKVSANQLKDLEKYLDKLFGDELGMGVDFTRHFLERVNDKRTKEQHGKPIKVGELRDIFRDTARNFENELKKMGTNTDAHMLKVSTQLNIPFTIQRDRKTGELEIVAKSVIKRGKAWVDRAKPQDGGKVLKTK